MCKEIPLHGGIGKGVSGRRLCLNHLFKRGRPCGAFSGTFSKNEGRSSIGLGYAHIEVILKDHINHIYAKEPGPLPSPEMASLTHEYEDPERVKDDEHGWEVKGEEVRGDRQRTCRSGSPDHKETI